MNTRDATRDVYVQPPVERTDREFIRLLNVAVYGLTNSNVKWQVTFDKVFFKSGLYVAPVINQFFVMRQNRRLVLLVAKIFDDLLVIDVEKFCFKFISGSKSKFGLGSIAHGSGRLHLYGLNLIQSTKT